MERCDVAVIGGGIVGLATAYRLMQAHPHRSVCVLEKEARVAAHQTGRNSGVIHSGIYYAPGSLKAENCRAGKRALVDFCEREGVAYEMCSKVIVAATPEEVPRLHAIAARGRKNRVAHVRIGPERLRETEPHVRGVEALHVPEAGIADYPGVARALACRLRAGGHTVRTCAAVTGLHVRTDGVIVETTAGDLEARYVVNCAGLYADRIAQMAGIHPPVQVVPFRGAYYELKPHARRLCRNLIYPTPDPAFPFLGVHFTRMVDGRVECGPSAVLAFAREGYGLADVHVRELWEILTYPGFLRLARRHWRKGLAELLQAVSTRYYLRAMRHLIPAIGLKDIRKGRTGVRAQALTPQGEMVDDFLFAEQPRLVHVLNAASPAATAGLHVGRLVARRLARRF